jgi:hypothetical protein
MAVVEPLACTANISVQSTILSSSIPLRRLCGKGFDHLLGLVDPGLIRVLDQEFVAVGTVRTIAGSEVAAELAAF